MKDDFDRKIGPRLHHVARLQRALAARQLHDIGLFPGQETVLRLLIESDGRTMTDLAAALKVRPPTASKTVGRLSVQGLLERRASEGDARLVRVYLTDEGRRRAEAIDAISGSLEQTLVAGLDGKERKRLRKLLRRIEKNIVAQLGVSVTDTDEEPETEEDETA